MRPARFAALPLAATLAAAAAGQAPAPPAGPAAQAAPYAAVVVQAEAEVRAAAGTDQQIYATNRLRRGQRVEVVKDRGDGWLEIKPPEGSFSWINTRFVERNAPNQPNWVVMNRAAVPVLVGSEVLKGRPTIEGVKLPYGAIVRSVGAPLADADGTWLPIEPPPGEVRYVRAEAVSKVGAPAAPGPAPLAERYANPTVAARVDPGAVSGNATSFHNPAAAGTALAPLTDVNALWQRAEQAQRAGNYAEAVRLYNQVAAESARTNREMAAEAYNRAYRLGEAARNPGASTFTPAADPAPVRLAPPAGSFATAPDPSGLPSSGPGVLRRSGRSLDGRQPLYYLEDARGIPRLYASPQPGVELEPFVNRSVELYGGVAYHGALRANHMAVARVQPLP